MAKSKYEYVKEFEQHASILCNTWIVVRLDGRGFHKFSSAHNYRKPNDVRALSVMNDAAMACMQEFQDIVLAYGESDEMTLVLDRETTLFGRRSEKLLSTIVSLFSSSFVMSWQKHMVNEDGSIEALQYPPQFDGRIVAYPTLQNLKDYLAWRQVDCHINNLYNTTFWGLVQKKGLTPTEAEAKIRGSISEEKHELLFTECGINYNDEPEMFRKGSVILWGIVEEEVEGKRPNKDGTFTTVKSVRRRRRITVTHQDMIGPEFWQSNADAFPVEELVFATGSGSNRRKRAKQRKKEVVLKKSKIATKQQQKQQVSQENMHEQASEQQLPKASNTTLKDGQVTAVARDSIEDKE